MKAQKFLELWNLYEAGVRSRKHQDRSQRIQLLTLLGLKESGISILPSVWEWVVLDPDQPDVSWSATSPDGPYARWSHTWAFHPKVDLYSMRGEATFWLVPAANVRFLKSPPSDSFYLDPATHEPIPCK